MSNEAVEKKKDSVPRKRRWGFGRYLLLFLTLLVVAVVGTAVWFRSRIAAGLPDTQGTLRLPGLGHPVTVERDPLGVPTIRAGSRLDAARALGFLHAQERFFQMDLLLRRRAAGEVSGLMGPHPLDWDRELRVHRFRARGHRFYTQLPPEQQALLAAYAGGVNAGLAALGAKPFEYYLLRTEPKPWLPEDSVLCVLTLFQELQSFTQEYESGLALMRETLPPALFDYLNPRGGTWDAPLVGGPLPSSPMPGPEVINLRQSQAATPPSLAELDGELAGAPARELAGSNAWAVAGRLTADGGALLANDVHLGIGVPNFWYRAELVFPGPDGKERRVAGATLPGTPLVAVGSNGSVAWGVTSSLIDASDIIELTLAPGNPNAYMTPQGPKPFERHTETIEVRGEKPQTTEVRDTIWGPVIGEDRRGRLRALAWAAHLDGAVNFDMVDLETAETIDQAIAIAHHAGVPAQNFLVADRSGRIGWTVLGRVPKRVGFDGRLPGSWADGTRRWEGFLPPEEVPTIVDPPSGILWSANNRAVDGKMLDELGDGGYRFGARAMQIRDDLKALQKPRVADMLKVQLDDRNPYLGRWHKLLLDEVLTPAAVQADPRRAEFRRLIEKWDGRADASSVSYRLVRGYRVIFAFDVLMALTARSWQANPQFAYQNIADSYEPILWELATKKPPHLLSPRYRTWNEQLLGSLDGLMQVWEHQGLGPLAEQSWGSFNRAAIRHVMSGNLGFFGRYLDMPATPLSGDADMPRVQAQSFGATFRMAVSPGKEEQGYFHMPSGQSGNPLSPHYGDSHPAWLRGEATPFLPGKTVEVLKLVP